MNKLFENVDCHIGASIYDKNIKIEIGVEGQKIFVAFMHKFAFRADTLKLISDALHEKNVSSNFCIGDGKMVLDIDMKSQSIQIYSSMHSTVWFCIPLAPFSNKFLTMIETILKDVEETTSDEEI